MATINYKDPISGNWVEIPIGGSSVTVDSELSSTSENPVQNKVINSALNGKLTAPTTPSAESVVVVGADGNVSTKLLTEFSSNITAIENTPSEDASIMKGLTIGGTDYSLPRRYRHTIYFSTTPNIVIYYEDENSSEITNASEIPSFTYYSAYVPTWEGGGVLCFYNDGTNCTASGVYRDTSGEVSYVELDLGDVSSQEVIQL